MFIITSSAGEHVTIFTGGSAERKWIDFLRSPLLLCNISYELFTLQLVYKYTLTRCILDVGGVSLGDIRCNVHIIKLTKVQSFASHLSVYCYTIYYAM